MKSPRSLLICSTLAIVGAGCKSSDRFPSEERSAERALAEAQRSGADRNSQALASARAAIEEARRAEKSALKSEKEARGQLEAAEKHLVEVERRLTARRSELRSAEAMRSDQRDALDRELERREELVERGATDRDLERTVDTDVALARSRLRADEAMVATLTQKIELDELERREADLERRFAQARLDTAEQRLKVARALYERAEDQAKLARSEELESKRASLRGAP